MSQSKGSPYSSARRQTRQNKPVPEDRPSDHQNKPVSEDQPSDMSPKTITELSMDDSAKIDWIFKEMQSVRKYMEDVDELKILNNVKM